MFEHAKTISSNEKKNDSHSAGRKHSTEQMSAKEAPENIVQRAKINPASLSQNDFFYLQRNIGNQGVMQFLKDADISITESAGGGGNKEASMDLKGLNFESPSENRSESSKQGHRTGLPGKLKTIMERFSGMNMDDVKVHFNSIKPKQLRARAYTQGTDIHLGPGEERHLAHEAWHVVQQAQGRVKPSMQRGKLKINNENRLEKEADFFENQASRYRYEDYAPFSIMGAESNRRISENNSILSGFRNMGEGQSVLQGKWIEAPDNSFALVRQGWQYWKPEANETGPEGWYKASGDGQYERMGDTGYWVLTEEGLIESPRDESQDEMEIAKPKIPPRTRKRHRLSDGESESEDQDIIYRALRPEEDPFEKGLKPPEGYNPDKTASEHITSGTKSNDKSGWVSASRSIKVAGAWASNRNDRVAKARIPKEKREKLLKDKTRAVYDLTDPEQAREIFPAGIGLSLNTAKASQEVIMFGGLPPEDILEVFQADTLSVKEYNRMKEEQAQGKKPEYDGKEVHSIFRTRATTKESPKPRILTKIPRPPGKSDPFRGIPPQGVFSKEPMEDEEQ